jgi:uncharacterized protein
MDKQESCFVYLLRIKNPDKSEFSAEEEKVLEKHFSYLTGLYENGKLVLAGPCLDRAFGIVILSVTCKDEAQSIMKNDPVVIEGIMTAELHPFHISIGI